MSRLHLRQPTWRNIQYSEVNFINEAWLDLTTDVENEAIVSRHQNKDDDNYSELLFNAFTEFDRILKPNKLITIAFHSSKAKHWRSVSSAWTKAGFAVVNTSVLNKEQGSISKSACTSCEGDFITRRNRSRTKIIRCRN